MKYIRLAVVTLAMIGGMTFSFHYTPGIMYRLSALVVLRALRALARSATPLVLLTFATGPALAGTVTLAWDPIISSSLAGYNIYYGASAGGYTGRIDVGNTTSYTISNLVEGATYHFAATAYDATHAESGFSNDVGVIIPYSAPVAQFSASTTSGTAPLAINFINSSLGTITSYAWTFGDGGTSTVRNPSHVYATAGTYTVGLTVTGPGGSNTQTLNNITVSAAAPVASFTASPGSIAGGGTLTATWSGIQTPSTLDWIGFYAVGDAPNANPIDWMFTNCSKTQNLVGSSGTCPLTIPNASPGNYELRLYSGFNLLATSNSITVTGTVAGTTLAASPASISAGNTLTATWSGIPAPTPMDWIGLYVPGAPEASYFDWIFVSCSKVASVALAAGSCPFTIPNVPPGTYELRMYANNSASLLGISSAFTITP